MLTKTFDFSTDLFIIGLKWFCNEKLDISIAY